MYRKRKYPFKKRFFNSSRLKIRKLLKDVKTLKSNVEKKYFDKDLTNATIDTSADIITNVSNMDTGATSITRIGNEIIAKSLYINLTFIFRDTTVPMVAQFRIMFLMDRDNNGSTPVSAYWLEYTSTQVVKMNSPLCKKDYIGRFKVLLDKHYNMPLCQSIYIGKGPFIVNIKKFIDLKNTKIKFAGTTAASFGKNAIFCYIAMSAANATPKLECYGYSRLIFTDA